MTKTFWMSLVLLSALATGCFNRAHMTENYGRAYRQAFSRQMVNPNAGVSGKGPTGLDALEAAIVVDTYRSELAQKSGGVDTSSQQMILLSPNAGQLGYTPYAPPASSSSTPSTK